MRSSCWRSISSREFSNRSSTSVLSSRNASRSPQISSPLTAACANSSGSSSISERSTNGESFSCSRADSRHRFRNWSSDVRSGSNLTAISRSDDERSIPFAASRKPRRTRCPDSHRAFPGRGQEPTANQCPLPDLTQGVSVTKEFRGHAFRSIRSRMIDPCRPSGPVVTRSCRWRCASNS